MTKRILCLTLSLLFCITLLLPAAHAAGETAAVFVTLAGVPLSGHPAYDPAAGYAAFLDSAPGQAALAAAEAALDRAQEAVLALDGATLLGRSSFLTLSLAVTLPVRHLAALAAIDGVASLSLIGTHFSPLGDEEAAETDDALLPAQADRTTPVYAPDLLGVRALHEAGITGDGVLVAVIDSGFDLAHPVFAAPDEITLTLTPEKLDALLPGLSAECTAEAAWISEKIPFAYDYAEGDADVSATDIHGTHVASILGGGRDADGRTVGIAPGAQLLLMKVFDDSARAGDYALYRAVEDALMLGADVISLSLGSSPGYPYSTSTFSLYRHLERARALGCAVVCAAGNDGAVGKDSAYDRALHIDFPLAANPDYGLIAEPASYPNSFAVGAYVPDQVLTSALGTGDGSLIGFSDSAAAQGFPDMKFTAVLDGQTLTYVVVPGVGTAADYADLDVTGRLALVRRGEISFTEKIGNAAQAGAVGLICYDHSEGALFGMAFDALPIPAVSVTLDDGRRLADAPTDQRTITVAANLLRMTTPADAGEPAAYSARGSGLNIRPSVLAPGSVYAAVPGGGYVTLSGTSMATPMVGGLAALWLCADDGEYRDGAALLDHLWAELITTASPLAAETGHPYPVRVQGGGRIDVEALFASESSLRAADGRGFCELGDGFAPDGEITFTLVLTNRSNHSKTYTVSASVSSDDHFDLVAESGVVTFAADRARVFGQAKVMLDALNVNRWPQGRSASPATILLRPGERRELTFTIALSGEEAAEYSASFPNGFYLEGYVWVEDTEGQTLTLPYLAFAGDFDALPCFDTFGYDGGESFFAQNLLYAMAGQTTLNLGCNYFAADGRFYSDLIAISPNGDGMLDEARINLFLLRNLYCLESEVRDEAGGLVWRSTRSFYLTKTFLAEGDQMSVNAGRVWDGQDDDNPFYVMPDGRYTVTYRVLAPGGATVEEVSLPIVLDTAPPVLRQIAISEFGDGETTRRMLTLTIADNHYPMRAVLYRSSYDRYGRETVLYRDVHDFSYVPGRREAMLIYDITGFTGDYLYLDVYDYAMNTHTYRIPLD